MGRPFLTNKTCSKCSVTFPATNEHFHFRNKEKGYLMSFCKPCKKLHTQENGEKNNELQRVRRNKKVRLCGACNEVELLPGKKVCKPCLTEKRRAQKRIDKALYKSRLRKAKPIWADNNHLRNIYINRPEGYHVDHIIPLKGKYVSGLHVPNNLQYLSADDNMAKNNHYSLEHWGTK